MLYTIFMTLHMWYLYENHDDGSICILTTPSNSLYVAALLFRVFFSWFWGYEKAEMTEAERRTYLILPARQTLRLLGDVGWGRL